MRENTEQNNSEYGHFLRSDRHICKFAYFIEGMYETDH